MTRYFGVLMSAAIVTASLSTPAFADEDNSDARMESDFSQMNTDSGNDGISPDEWDSGFDQGGVFNNWDANGDGFLSPQEHRNGYFSCFDRNGNGRISRDEHDIARRDARHCGIFGG